MGQTLLTFERKTVHYRNAFFVISKRVDKLLLSISRENWWQFQCNFTVDHFCVLYFRADFRM